MGIIVLNEFVSFGGDFLLDQCSKICKLPVITTFSKTEPFGISIFWPSEQTMITVPLKVTFLPKKTLPVMVK